MSQSLIRPKIYPVLSMVAVLSMVLSACTGSGDSSKSGNFELANDSASTVVPTTKAPTPVPTIPAPTTKKSIEILDKDDGYRATLEFSVSDV